MKKIIMMALVGLIWHVAALAAGTQYQLGVDGLACPFCAYGVEKKLSSIEGVESIKVDIVKGQVIVTMTDDIPLTELVAGTKVEQAGFTLRSFSQVIENE